MKGEMAYPVLLMLCITVVYFWLLCCTAFGRPWRSEPVTTAPVDIWPIMKPVLLKLYVLLSWMLYLALVFSTRRN